MTAEHEPVRSARLADWLGVSRPTVTVALRRMVRDGMIRIDSRKEIQLTARGSSEAEAIVRRHRIVERWLTDSLGLDWVQADEEAARLEHAISETVEQRLYEALGRPLTCPHGNPIPGHSEVVPGELPLARLAVGRGARVTRISEVAEREAPQLLGYLLERRIVPGTPVQLREVDDVTGTVTLALGGRTLAMGLETAARVWVVPD